MIGSRNWSAVWKFEDWFVKKNEKIFKHLLTNQKTFLYLIRQTKLNPSGLIANWNFGKTIFHFAGVAQLVEQLICNQPVGGSDPSTSAKH